MKNIFLLVLILITVSCKSQIYSLKSHVPTPENAYLKDIDNDLPHYEGVWKGTWDNKIIYVTFDKIIYKYIPSINQYYDMLIGRFKVTDLNGTILFDNSNVLDENVKIQGTRFRKQDGKYSLIYIDMELCERSGKILINFTDSTKSQLRWSYSQDENFIEPDCFYYSWAPQDYPQPLPNNIILTKQ